MKEERSMNVEIATDLARLSEWFGSQMLRATPFVLIAGGILFGLAGLFVEFYVGFLVWVFFMGFFFLKAALYKTIARWIDKIDQIDQKYPPEG